MFKKLLFGAFCVVLLSLSNTTFAQVRLTLSNVPKTGIESGKSQTVVLNATNLTKDTLKIVLDLNIPSPFRALLFNKKITLYPKDTKPILIPISVPRSAEAGSYNMTFGLKLDGNIIAQEKATFQVLKRTNIRVELIEKPSYARTIDTIKSRFIVVNQGNSREQISLYSANGVIQQERSLSIPPDSTIYVDLYITNDKKSVVVKDQLIDLFCNIAGVGQAVGDQEVIKVYPIKTMKIDPFFRFPVTANVNYFTQNSNGEYYNSTYQFEIAGNGALDVESKHKLNFSYRGPGAVRITRLGNFSQKFIGYSSKKTQLFIGEKSFGLSELTENFRFGTGIDFATHIDSAFQIGAYYNRPIFQPEIQQQFGSFISYYTKKKHNIRLNSLNNYLREGPVVNLTSVQVDFTDYKDWRFKAEASRSFSQGKDGSAITYNTNVNGEKLRFSSSGLYADKNFQGYYNNSLYASANLGYNLKSIGFQINGNYNNANPNLDTVFSVAPITFYTSGGVIGRIRRSFTMQVMAVYREKTDRLASKNFDYTEKRARVTMSFKRKKFSSRFLAEAGNTTNKLSTGVETNFGYDAQLQFSYRPKYNFWVSAFSQYLKNNRFTTTSENYLLYGVDANLRLKDKFNFSVEYQNNYLIEDLFNDRNLLNMRLGLDISKSQTIGAMANYGILHQAPIRRDWYLSANYIMRLGVPMTRTKSLGTVEGQLENKGVESVENVVLILDGQLVTTDEAGNFTFNNVTPGKHQLIIDKATIGVRDVPDMKLPIEIDVYGEMTQTINIPMTKSAKVVGKISLEKVRMLRSSQAEVKFPSVVVEAYLDGESFLTRADMDGNFVFGSLRPGNWKFRMVPTYWKEDFIIKIPYLMQELAAGDEVQIEMTLTPKVSQVKFLNTKKLKIGGN